MRLNSLFINLNCNMFNYQTLDNKLRIITVPLKETKAVTVLVMAKVGSRYEVEGNKGISHFIEHMFFKGTKKWPSTLALSQELDGVGAEFNAFTAKDHTGYYIKADASHLDLVLDLLSDMLYSSKFDEKEIEKEKGVITEEMNMYHDNPLIYTEDLFEQSIYQGNKLGWDIIGTKETINSTTRSKIISYLNQYYANTNLVIGIAGAINDAVVRKVTEFFSSKNIGKSENNYKKFSSKQNKSRVKIMFKETEQIQIGLGFPAYGYGHKDLYAFQLLSIILGGNMSSRLFVNIRGKQGLCYYIKCQPNVYQDTGNLYIQAGLDKNKIEKAIKLIIKELNQVKKSGVTVKELQKAKDFIKGKTVLALEDSLHQAEWYVKQAIFERELLSPEERFKLFDAVTKDDILKVAKDIINDKKLNLVVIGPYKDQKYFEKLI